MFAGEGASLEQLEEFHRTGAFRAGMNSLIGVTHRHLQNALEFTCLIPAREAGMRRFCLWALGLAVMTLQKVYRNPHFTSGDQVKVSATHRSGDHPGDQSHSDKQPVPVFALQVRSQRTAAMARGYGDLDEHGRAGKRPGPAYAVENVGQKIASRYPTTTMANSDSRQAQNPLTAMVFRLIP